MKILDVSLVVLLVFCLGCEKEKPSEQVGKQTNRFCSVKSAEEGRHVSKDEVMKIVDKINEWSADVERLCFEGDAEQIDCFVTQLKEMLLPLEYRLRKQLLFEIEYAVRHVDLYHGPMKENVPVHDLAVRLKNFCHFSEAISSLAFFLTEDAIHSADLDLDRGQTIKCFIVYVKRGKLDELVPLGEAKFKEWLEKCYDSEDCYLKLAMERGHGKGIDHPEQDTYELRIETLKSFFRTVRIRPPKWYVGDQFKDW